MGKIIRAVRQRRPHKIPTSIYKKGTVSLPKVKGTFKAVIKELIHEPGRSAPLARINMKIDGKSHNELIVATEGMYVGKEIQFGENVDFDVGNCIPLKEIPEGSLISFVEKRPFDGGKFAKSSGSYVILTHQNRDTNTSTLLLRSGVKVNVSADSRCILGIIAGGGKVDKPLLKAGNAAYKHKYKRGKWPRVRGVAMNPVEHPHGGGNYQHVGRPTTISKHTPINARVGLVGARQTGRKKGSKRADKQ